MAGYKSRSTSVRLWVRTLEAVAEFRKLEAAAGCDRPLKLNELVNLAIGSYLAREGLRLRAKLGEGKEY